MTPDFNFQILNLNQAERRLQAWQQFQGVKLEIRGIERSDFTTVSDPRGWRNKAARVCALVRMPEPGRATLIGAYLRTGSQ